jgi:uncharacterized membrane protein
MSPETLTWILTGHLIGVFFWIGTMFATYWLLRVHAHAPQDVRDQLTLMERSLALTMDLAATVAIGCGIALIFYRPGPNLFAAPHSGWFHIKLTVVVLGVLPVHGFVRAKIKRFSQNKVVPVPQWPWSLLLVAIAAIVFLVKRGPLLFS